ncbi:MAG: IS5 family transposase [Thermodesulfobacteriota bacterium]|nr:IS5 family transposase [Thermodesulfobacteriota bacterium]
MQTGLFDWQFRFEKLEKNGDPLRQLNEVVNWESFRPTLSVVHDKERKSNAGAKPYDVVMMFKILVIQSLYNLSDDAVEYQILDRISFMRFLGLSLGDRVPDAKTSWLFREQLTKAKLIKKLFRQFDQFLRNSGFAAKKGQIVDASIVSTPKQRNSRDENKRIKKGKIPEDWNQAKRRQKDTDARWVKKMGKNHYGYKNHINIDVKNKLIRDYAVTDAATHDSQVFDDLLDDANTSRDVFADSAYWSKDRLQRLSQRGFRERVQRKGCRHQKLTEREKRGNHTRSKTRCRIEHVFGVQAMIAGDLILRTIGIVRARAKIGLRNLAYNILRYKTLLATG